MMYAVIMAGGSGTRFWPASRNATPKQLLRLAGERTMIQATADRLEGLCDLDRCLVVTNQRWADLIARQIPEIPRAQIIGEPCKRDTAPCIGLAAHWVRHQDADATLLVMPADHVIQSSDRFRSAVQRGCRLIAEDPSRLVTFGIKPTYPAEAFGYIEREPSPLDDDQPSAFGVRRFREKPNLATAQRFLDQGGFYWNSGIFLWRADEILRSLNSFEPEMAEHLQRIASAISTPAFLDTLDREFQTIAPKSIDYAVLERHANVCVVEAPFDWDDVGNWTALPRLLGIDASGNTIQGNHLGIDTKNSIVYGDDKHLIVTVGLEDCIVVHTPDATLVANRNCEEKIRAVVQSLEARGQTDYL